MSKTSGVSSFPLSSSDVASSLSCVCVTFLLTGGSCRSLLCRSVFTLVRVATCSCFLDVLVRAVCVLISVLVLRADPWQPMSGLDGAVPCLFSVTRSRECLAMPSRGPCCSPLDPWFSLLRGPSVFDRLPGTSFYRREVRVTEHRVACDHVALLTVTDTVTPVCRGQAAGSERRAQCEENKTCEFLCAPGFISVSGRPSWTQCFRRSRTFVVIVERFVLFNAARHVAVVLRRTPCYPQSCWKFARTSWTWSVPAFLGIFTMCSTGPQGETRLLRRTSSISLRLPVSSRVPSSTPVPSSCSFPPSLPPCFTRSVHTWILDNISCPLHSGSHHCWSQMLPLAKYSCPFLTVFTVRILFS